MSSGLVGQCRGRPLFILAQVAVKIAVSSGCSKATSYLSSVPRPCRVTAKGNSRPSRIRVMRAVELPYPSLKPSRFSERMAHDL